MLNNLELTNLNGKTFLDIGSGSGLFSLAAYNLGATVHSFDYDKDSVECTKTLRDKYCKNISQWKVEQGSILDNTFLNSLEKVDIVYSWGVLHHTGNMYKALDNAALLVKDNGYLFISIYNDQGFMSKIWHIIKDLYNRANPLMRKVILFLSAIRLWGPTFVKVFFKCGNPFRTWLTYNKNRGMSAYYDLVDWVGGYPFEVATPESIFNFFKKSHGFFLNQLKTCAGGIGCNEFVFHKIIK